MGYETISVSPNTGALGAEVSGVDLSQPLDGRVVAEIRRALLENLVLVFRNQNITPEHHKAFAASFGELDIHPYSVPLAGHPEILEIVKEKDDRVNFGGGWHADMTYIETPPLGVVLVARELPPRGGDTLFANLYAAYDALSDAMKQRLEGMQGVHDAGATYGATGTKSRENQSTKVVITGQAQHSATHPVVRTHPETKRKSIFVNDGHTVALQGFSKQESKALLSFLFEHCEKHEFAFRLSWTEGTVVIWDNRCTHHMALNDYHGHRRVIHRVVIRGDRPY
ncbi:TauD/TfdA dioxygenase family protein [Bradyrhizobium sp. SZCCHNRI20481]|uniref:TauD/TfdA dioxygenase family protein n=1 Tax=Bradyrhizobium sp. SZCCHNRI20481 TaxID=3057286 RepID=UPI002916068C|nr:TauD/TfdA family dioxygenase [Bradyrhizobium sp. SZCCHNRI20481]